MSVPPASRFAWIAGTCLAVGVTLGTLLRGVLAGVPLLIGDFGNLRRAHSHLGYYGVLFPLAWWAWSKRGPAVPGRITTLVYAVAVFGATIGFAWEGYGLTAIVCSTVVLLVWLGSAWRAAPFLIQPRSWFGPAAPAIVGSAVAIPMVAVFFERDPTFSTELVQFFLTLLLFGVIVPAALSTRQAAAPFSALWAVSTFGAALALGPWPAWPALTATGLLGVQIAWAGWHSDSPWDLRLLWVGLGAGLVLIGSGLLVEQHAVAIAGLHYAILGPVLVSLGRPLCPRGPRWLCLFYDGLVGLLTAAVLLPLWLPYAAWPVVAAIAGATIAVCWILALVLKGWQRE